MDTRTLMSTHSPPPGNEALHGLTKAGDYSLRVDLRDGDEAVFAQYDSFQVDSADEFYRLHLEGYHGTAGEGWAWWGEGRDGVGMGKRGPHCSFHALPRGLHELPQRQCLLCP